jgi:uncharacterized protein
MADSAARVLMAGLSVILDATSLRRGHRASLLAAARPGRHPTVLLTCVADEATLADRVARRARSSSDPSEAGLDVVHRQQAEYEAVLGDEASLCLRVDTTATVDPSALARRIHQAAGASPMEACN